MSEGLPDYDDPCKAYRELRDAKQRILTGQQEYEFEYLGNGVQRRVKYSVVNMAALEQEIAKAKAACEAQMGLPDSGRRFAIRGGFGFGSNGRDGYRPPAGWPYRRD